MKVSKLILKEVFTKVSAVCVLIAVGLSIAMALVYLESLLYSFSPWASFSVVVIGFVYMLYVIYKRLTETDDVVRCGEQSYIESIRTYKRLLNGIKSCNDRDVLFDEYFKEVYEKYSSDDAIIFKDLLKEIEDRDSILSCNNSDFYMCTQNCIDRLVSEYKKHGKLIVALDFDNTIYDFHHTGMKYEKLITLLKNMVDDNIIDIVIFSNKEEKDYNIIYDYVKEIDLKIVGINVDVLPNMKGRKMYANIYVDDRGGLRETYLTLSYVYDIILNEKK